jgi:hypothetical protein
MEAIGIGALAESILAEARKAREERDQRPKSLAKVETGHQAQSERRDQVPQGGAEQRMPEGK